MKTKELKLLCDLTYKLVELRQRECSNLCLEVELAAIFNALYPLFIGIDISEASEKFYPSDVPEGDTSESVMVGLKHCILNGYIKYDLDNHRLHTTGEGNLIMFNLL